MSNEIEKFLLDEREMPVFIDDGSDGLHITSTNISELEQCENRNQCRLIEGIFHTVYELFEIDNLEMQVTGHSISFLLITKPETDFNNQYGLESPQLSRRKLLAAEPKKISEAIISLIRNRHSWNTEKQYKTFNL